MSDIRFESPDDEFGPHSRQGGGLDIGAMLIRWGVASDRRKAEYILIGIAVSALVLGFFVYRVSLTSGATRVMRTQMDAAMNAGQQYIPPSSGNMQGI